MPLLNEDADLLDAFRKGEPAALDRVYRHYAPKVAGFLRAGFVVMSGGTAVGTCSLGPFEVESVVQEVFYRALAPPARAAYDGVRSYLDFLIGIGRHVAIDELRRRQRAFTIDRSAVLQEVETNASTPAPEESVDARRASELVAAFLDGECDDRDRRLYALRFRDDLTQEAAAQAAGLTRIQVRRWEQKLRARLLRYLKRVNYVR